MRRGGRGVGTLVGALVGFVAVAVAVAVADRRSGDRLGHAPTAAERAREAAARLLARRALVDGAMPGQLAYESAVPAAPDADRQDEPAGLLGELLTLLEGHMQALRI